MEIYLDNSATTKMYDACIDKMSMAMRENYGNPSSLHRKGMEAEKLLKYAKETVADTLKVSPNEIFFTSGGTEADNLAIRGTVKANRGNHILTTAVEHPAVMSTLEYLSERGYKVEKIPVTKEGIVDLNAFSKMVRGDTVLVSAMYVNNETGAVMPVSEMGKIYKSKNPKGIFHIDAVQAYGKFPFTAAKTGADLISLSSHKIHGPKGVGALYVKSGTKLAPIVFGGGQQNNLRPGTENVHGIYGFGIAADLSRNNILEKEQRMRRLVERLKTGIENNISDIKINTPKNCAPHILSVSFSGTKSEVLLHSLEIEGIYVSSGSACSSHKKGPSYVLTSMGLDRKLIDGTIRFSLSEFTTEEEIDYTVASLAKIVSRVRILMRK
ncbi:MAG: cysteine desulfurase [Ruminococcaceae bacterium]|nr:cysteine desulfurase [Oscillospiraceae bacterium]